jgi:hypothetical protein
MLPVRSIVGVAIPPLKSLTAQGEVTVRESSKASASRRGHQSGFLGGLAASQGAASLNGPIVIGYGEELTASC